MKIGWLGDPNLALISIIIAALWRQVGYVMTLYLAGLKTVTSLLADPESKRNPGDLTPMVSTRNEYRSIKPEIFVGVGICSHLGCSPSDKFATGAQPSLPDNWGGGFLCPCHGSTFDMAGRVYKNKPAPDNLEVPPHMYMSDTRLLIGEDKKA